MRPEGTSRGRRVSWPVLIALFIIPLLVVTSLIGLVKGDDERVTAAIVNLDEGTEVEGQFVPMGRQLAAEMMDREGENIRWILADEESGKTGIVDGEYAAVVTIPDDFSEKAMSFSANDADVAEKARIDVTISENAPVRDSVIAQEIARIATASLNDMLTGQYLEGIYLGFNEVGDQFGQIVDGANQLKDGSGQLSDGMGEAYSGAGELADGMNLLADGSGQLTDGGDQLADGSTELESGATQLADGARQLDDGIQTMAAQMPQLTGGVQQLADGAQQLLPGVRQYTEGTAQVVDGVAQLEDGLDQVVTGMDEADMDPAQLQQLADGSQQLADGIDQLVTPLEDLEGVVDQDFVDGVAGLQGQAEQLGSFVRGADAQLRGYADGSLAIPDEVLQMAAQMKTQFTCPVDDPDVCTQLQQAFEDGVDQAIIGGFRQGAQQGTDALHSIDPNTGQTYVELADRAGSELSTALGPIVEGLSQADEIIPQLVAMRDGSQQIADGVDQLATELPKQMGELRDGLGQLRDGAGQIVDQSQPLVTGGAQLADGSDQLNAGIQQLNSQLGQLPDGVARLADGSSQLADGAGELAGGVGQFSTGVYRYVDGVWQFADGVGQAADGTGELVDGLGQLDDGVTQLDDGVGTFADKLSEGADQVPYYSESDRTTLANVISGPVASDGSLMARGNVALTSLILVGVLWLASLAAFTIARPIPSDAVASRASSAALWLRTVGLPSAIVMGAGLVLGIVGGNILSLPAGRTTLLALLLAGLGGVFSVVHHALTGWLGHIGRGISLVLLAITVALGLSSAVPGWLDAVAALSPLHSGMQLIRSWLAGAPVVTSVAAMVFVGSVFAALSWAAIAMRRQLKPSTFKLRYA